MGSLAKGQVDVAALTGRIRAAFPDLAFQHAALNDLGEDHAVLMLDDTWVFRFPRGPEAASYAAGERRMLAALAETANLPVPRYERIAPDGSFAGYRRIAGEELTEARFAALPRVAQEQAIAEIGRFLARLHALPLALTADVEKVQWNGQVQARRYADRRDNYMRFVTPELLVRIDAFYAAMALQASPAVLKMVHNDFTEDHILIDPETGRLTGIIDFTDAGPDDPAFDFTFLRAYGDWTVDAALEAYGAGAEHAAMRERSLWQYVRYRIEQLWWNARGFRRYDVGAVLKELPRRLDYLGV